MRQRTLGGGLTLPKTMNEKNVHVDDSIAIHILLIMIVLIAKLAFMILVCMFFIYIWKFLSLR